MKLAKVFRAGSGDLESVLKLPSGGGTIIDTSKFDAFLLVGLTKSYFVEDYCSGAVLKVALDGWYAENLGVLVGSTLFDVTSKPVYLLHNPLSSNSKFDDYPKCEEYLGGYINGLGDANKYFMESKGLSLLSQPLETINGDGKSTKSSYSKGSIGLKTQSNNSSAIHPEDDNSHMNQDYGYLVLKELVSKYFDGIDVQQRS